MCHWPAGICRAWPARDRSRTWEEQAARTAGLACTMLTSKVDASEGMMPIANVCHVCALSQGNAPTVMTPSFSFTPFQHSGDAGQRAPAPGTDAAGQWLLVVAIPNVPM